CPHTGQGVTAISSRHQRHTQGSSEAVRSAASCGTSTGYATLSTSFEVPHHFGPRGVGSTLWVGSRPSAVLTGPVIQPVSPPWSATTSREARVSDGRGTEGVPAWMRCTEGCGHEETPNAAPGVKEPTCWPNDGCGVVSPLTLPSQVKTCSSASMRGSSETSIPGPGTCGAIAEAKEARTAAASGGRGVRWIDRRSVSSAARTISRRTRAEGSSQSGTMAQTWPPASIPEVTASTTISVCSRVGGSMKASIRLSEPRNRSGLRPNVRVTGRTGACGCAEGSVTARTLRGLGARPAHC
ncbi:MAG: hypothetical protein AVDCRST_MAG30-2016, partial [uncultured Solirubrobacteraceae bacterium]